MRHSSPRQKKNCLQNYDLSEHRQILSDLAIHIYHQFISAMEKSLTPAIGNWLIDVTLGFTLNKQPTNSCLLLGQCLVCWSMRACRAFLA